MERSTIINGAPIVVTLGVVASDNAIIFPDDLAQTLGYDGSGNVTTITIVVPATPGTTYAGGTYVQTLTYTSGNLTGVSKWVKQ
jgi:hypothetical protein